MKKEKIATPIYHKIALDIASKISDGQYDLGEKLYARSTIASSYSVSPETARRAISVLADLGIVEAEKGSGIVIKSVDNAQQFIRQAGEYDTVLDIKSSIMSGIERQKQEIDKLLTSIREYIDITERFSNTNPFVPFAITIERDMAYLNKTTAETNFWHNTTATVIAIKRDEKTIISPGPYAIFRENDVFYLVGDENAYEKVKKFMYPQKIMKE